MYNILSIGNSSATKPFPKFDPKDWLTERGKKQKN
jgi:hypothetical protein